MNSTWRRRCSPGLELLGAQRVGDVLDGVAQAVSVVVRRVDTPADRNARTCHSKGTYHLSLEQWYMEVRTTHPWSSGTWRYVPHTLGAVVQGGTYHTPLEQWYREVCTTCPWSSGTGRYVPLVLGEVVDGGTYYLSLSGVTWRYIPLVLGAVVRGELDAVGDGVRLAVLHDVLHAQRRLALLHLPLPHVLRTTRATVTPGCFGAKRLNASETDLNAWESRFLSLKSPDCD